MYISSFLLFFSISECGKGLMVLMVDMLHFILLQFFFLPFFFHHHFAVAWPVWGCLNDPTLAAELDGPLMDLKWHQSTRAGDAGSPVKHFFMTRTSSRVQHVMWLQLFQTSACCPVLPFLWPASDSSVSPRVFYPHPLLECYCLASFIAGLQFYIKTCLFLYPRHGDVLWFVINSAGYAATLRLASLLCCIPDSNETF